MKNADIHTGGSGGGFPSPAEHFPKGSLSLDDYLVKRPAATFFMRMEGEARVLQGICPGDILVVDRSLAPAPGDLAVVVVENEYLVRVWRKGKDGGVRLEAANPAFEPIDVPPRHPVDLFGKVTAVVRKL